MSGGALQNLDKVLTKIEQDFQLNQYQFLHTAEQNTGLRKGYFVLGALGFFGFFIFFNIAAGFLTLLLGWALPAYFSLKALETPEAKDDVQWLTYWTVFGALTIVESLINVVKWFPYYYTVKCAFIIWLMLPSTKGAVIVYNQALRPLVAQGKRAGVVPAHAAGPSPTSSKIE